MFQRDETDLTKPVRRVKYVPVVGPRLRRVLALIFALFALLVVNSVYLVSITIMEYVTKLTYQNYFYQIMFLAHLGLGLAIVLPVVLFGMFHIRNAHNRPNRRAVRAGYALFATSLILLFSGVVLTRAFVPLKESAARDMMYWIHVISPLAVVWLFILHRLAGRRIKWKVGLTWAAVAGVFALSMTVLHSQDPRGWGAVGPKEGAQYFFPSLARTSTGNFIRPDTLMMDQYCVECHPDTVNNWLHSAHRFSSFSNPAYLFSVRETRRVAKERDGTVQASRWCAGCHDPAPFFSGEFEDARFDDPDYDLAADPMAGAGIGCTVCHGITHINSTKGNADFTIGEIAHYPWAASDNPFLLWVNKQLILANPSFHKSEMLKPLHTSPEFCSTCHKVHLPPELNKYKWLRGQNHFDSYHLSGVSGHGIQSWYYPPKAIHNCASCHMPLVASSDFGAKALETDSSKPLFGELAVHDHLFPSANTGVPHLLDMPEWVNAKHDQFMQPFVRVDIFGLKKGGGIDGELVAPIRPEVPLLEPGQTYLMETVIRTLKLGHPFTQGTVDSNEVWMDVTLTSGGRVIGRSGGLRPGDREVDPWSHFVNVYMLDRDGNRIDRRNPQDIFTPLYNHQIPPGAADVIHYAFTVPPEVREPIIAEVKLQYRKFDTTYMKLFQGEQFQTNDLPISTLASDRVIFSLVGVQHDPASVPANEDLATPAWERWNDYGIGLFRKGDSGSSKGELRQAEAAFAEVEKLDRPDGPLNRARVYIKEGRLDEAAAALALARDFDPAAPPWSVAYFTGLVNKQNGYLDDAIANFKEILAMKDTEECRRREFDFTQDYTLLNELGQTIFERAKQERGESNRPRRTELLNESVAMFQRVIELDAEDLSAHYNLSLIYEQLGEKAKADEHRELHQKYKPDDNARDRAIAIARMNSPAANHAAEAVVIYDLQRPEAFELSAEVIRELQEARSREVARHE
jgi:tetratricopeptide (TPR) repeat protein